MAITQNGVELTVAITEKAAEKIKYFAAKDGMTENVGVRVAEYPFADGRNLDESRRSG